MSRIFLCDFYIFLEFRFEVCENFAFFLHFLKDYPIGLVNEKLTIKRADNWLQLSKKYHSLDALRILAILKFLEAHGSTLKQQEWETGIAAMKNKITILNKGAARRRKKGEFTALEKKIATVIKKEKSFQSTNTNPKNHYPVVRDSKKRNRFFVICSYFLGSLHKFEDQGNYSRHCQESK